MYDSACGAAAAGVAGGQCGAAQPERGEPPARAPPPPPERDYSGFDIVKATQYGAFARVKELVEAGWDVNQPDHETVTLLHWAAINNRREIIEFLLSRGARVDAVGGELRSTPLQWAARQGHLEAVVLLVRAGADPALRDAEGCASLHLAAQFGHTAVVAYLVARGADADAGDAGGMTALMWACWKVAAVDPARLLLTLGASTQPADRAHGNTALHWAILARNATAVSTLVLYGNASLEVPNARGQTPLAMLAAPRARRVRARAAARPAAALVAHGRHAAGRLLPHGAGAGAGGARGRQAAAAGGAVRGAARGRARSARRRPQERLPAQRLPRHQGVVLHHVGGVHRGRGGRGRHAAVRGVVAAAVVLLPEVVALGPGRDLGVPRRAAAHHRGAVGARPRGLRAGSVLLRVPGAAPAALQALLRLQPLRRQVRPPLPLGRQLHRRQEPRVLHRVPGEPAGHVRVDGVGRRTVLPAAVRRRGLAGGRGAELGALQRVAHVGAGQRRLPPVLGDRADGLPAVPGGVPGHDDQRAAEPRPLPPLPGAGRPLALLPRPAAQLRGLLPVLAVRPAAAAGHGLGRAARAARAARGPRPAARRRAAHAGRRAAALRVTGRPRGGAGRGPLGTPAGCSILCPR